MERTTLDARTNAARRPEREREDLTMNLPNTFADKDCLVFEQGSDGGLYIGTDVGVYFTDNKRIAAFDPLAPEDADDLSNTSGWVRLGGALPHVLSHGLEINYQVNRLRNGMNGRGVWEHGLRCPPDPEDRSETSVYTADAFVEARNDVGSDAVVPAGFKVSYRAGNSVHLTPGFHAQSASRFHAFIHPCEAPGNSFTPKSAPAGFVTEDREASAEPSGLWVYPNPSHGQLNVYCSGLHDDADASISLVDARGQVVWTYGMHSPAIALDVSGLRGLYIIVVVHNGVLLTAKTIIE